jgi:hypothetical protein
MRGSRCKTSAHLLQLLAPAFRSDGSKRGQTHLARSRLWLALLQPQPVDFDRLALALPIRFVARLRLLVFFFCFAYSSRHLLFMFSEHYYYPARRPSPVGW